MLHYLLDQVLIIFQDQLLNYFYNTKKKTILEPIGERQLSEQLQGIFPDVYETIKKESQTFKERIVDLDKIIDKLSKSSESATINQVTFEFEFFTGGQIQNLIHLLKDLG